ncbi:MAG: hypothetical protein O8C63_08040 [Candidatus Methanoperedens sp.]|nr:hypothetical protein [Candidatus Methanoperedens sp.]
MKKNKFPKGWDEERVKRVLSHYEKQTEDEAVAEDEAAYKTRTQTAMDIPVQLVPKVRELIAKHQALHDVETTADNIG